MENFAPGDNVFVCGLLADPEFNAKAVKLIRFDHAKERWIVKLPNGDLLAVLPTNLARASKAMESETSTDFWWQPNTYKVGGGLGNPVDQVAAQVKTIPAASAVAVRTMPALRTMPAVLEAGYTAAPGAVNLGRTSSSRCFRVGDVVEYNTWVTTRITNVNHETNEVEVDCNTGAWISTSEQQTKLRHPQRSSQGSVVATPVVAQGSVEQPLATMTGLAAEEMGKQLKASKAPSQGSVPASCQPLPTMLGLADEDLWKPVESSDPSSYLETFSSGNMLGLVEKDAVQIWRESTGAWVDGIVLKDNAFGCQGPDGVQVPSGSVCVQFDEDGIKSKWIPPCFMGLLRRKDAAPPQRLKCAKPSQSVLGIIKDSDMAFLRVEALRKLTAEGRILPRKQDLPESGLDFVKGSGAVREWINIDSEYPSVRIFITSHPWFSPGHPDPEGAKLRSLLRELAFVGASDHDLVFIDFSSLPQRPRSDQDDLEFDCGLKGMNKLYMDERSEVLVVPEVPQDAPNKTPYEQRGWCHFELSISKQAGRIANQAKYDVLVAEAASANAMGALFETGKLKFTNTGDKDKVVRMLFDMTNEHRMSVRHPMATCGITDDMFPVTDDQSGAAA